MQDASARRFVLAAGLVALTLCALSGYWLWVLLDHRLQFTHRQVALQTASVAEHASTVFRAVDASLLATVDELIQNRVDVPKAHTLLQLSRGGSDGLIALSLVDGDGRVLASSWGGALPAALADLSQGALDGLRVGAPAANPFDRRRALEFVRAVPGEPGGVAQVVATVDTRFIAEFFARVAYAKDAEVGLFNLDGTQLAGSLDLTRLMPPGTDARSALRGLLEARADAGTAHGPVFAAAQRLPGLPIVAVTQRERAAVLAPWYEYLVSACLATLAALVLLTVAVHRLQRERQARVHAQAALERSREEARVAAETSRQRTRRLESLGRLSGGIAHDFNNILALILGHGDLLAQQLGSGTGSGDGAARHLDQLLRAGERGRSLVARILAFTRGGPRAGVPLAVDTVVAEALDALTGTLPAHVQIEHHADAAGAWVLGDTSQLFESLNNLFANALHAMPDGGRLAVRTATLNAPGERTLSHGTLAAGRHAVIEVADTGLGMGAEVLEHLFEPFFTTRTADGGTGLGLAMVHGAVKEMSGAIDVQSAPAAGSRFTLYLPLFLGNVAAEPPPDASAARGHGQVVMVVDDEPALVALTEEVLAGLGYEPVGFRDPRQALAVMREGPDRFDALLTDQVMPGMTGTELARQWHALRPGAPILLATGFGGRDLERQAREVGVTTLLQKPLHRGELAAELARALTPT